VSRTSESLPGAVPPLRLRVGAVAGLGGPRGRLRPSREGLARRLARSSNKRTNGYHFSEHARVQPVEGDPWKFDVVDGDPITKVEGRIAQLFWMPEFEAFELETATRLVKP
jgi:hypothetical protein